jgi:hypothetical protein
LASAAVSDMEDRIIGAHGIDPGCHTVKNEIRRRAGLILIALLLLIFASLLHSWYAGNSAARVTQRAIGFLAFGGYVLAFSVFLLIGGLALLWISKSFYVVLAGAAIYFLLLPLLISPLLSALDATKNSNTLELF